jgi:hypothetical protein
MEIGCHCSAHRAHLDPLADVDAAAPQRAYCVARQLLLRLLLLLRVLLLRVLLLLR